MGKWPEKYFVICDPDDPMEAPDTALESAGPLREDAPTSIMRANQGLIDFGLRSPDPWGGGFDFTQEGDPLLVEREDLDPPQYYYLVPFRRPNGEVPLVVNVSAHERGGVNGSISVPGTTHFSQIVDRETVRQQFAGIAAEAIGHSGPLRLYEYLVWRPCIESLSPYWPFYRFDAEGPDGEISVYVRIDGEVFPELHVGFGL
jgi:hypothetical protein